jgi:hypothetical protein
MELEISSLGLSTFYADFGKGKWTSKHLWVELDRSGFYNTVNNSNYFVCKMKVDRCDDGTIEFDLIQKTIIKSFENRRYN